MHTLRKRQTDIEADATAVATDAAAPKAPKPVTQKPLPIEKILRKLQFSVLGRVDEIVQAQNDLSRKQQGERQAAVEAIHIEDHKELDPEQRAERRAAYEDVLPEDETAMVAAQERKLKRIQAEILSEAKGGSSIGSPASTKQPRQKGGKLKRDEAAEIRRREIKGKGGWEGGLGHWEDAAQEEDPSPQQFLRRGVIRPYPAYPSLYL